MKILISIALSAAALSLSAQTQPNYAAQVISAGPSVVLDFNDATTSFKERRTNVTFIPSGAGTITPHVQGFDLTSVTNAAATFPYNGFIVAPNNTLGDFEWNQPWSVQIQLNDFQATRSSDEPLIGKGNVTPLGNNQKGYLLFSHWDSGNSVTEFCTQISATGSTGNLGSVNCTAGAIDFRNGYNYNIVWTHDGTGSPAGDALWVNDASITLGLIAGSGTNPGNVSLAHSGGTGYATSTAFTSTGGGSSCTVTGTMTSSSGVPASLSFTNNYGCTSSPTIVLTSPTGTGVTITPTVSNAVISTSTTTPMTIMGANGSGFGSSGNPALTVDEVAIFPSVVDQYLIAGTFTHTKFYQNLVSAPPASPPYVILTNDGLGDMDNYYSLQELIALHKLGYVRLIAVNQDNGTGVVDAQMYRVMLDQAGLHHVPVSRPSALVAGGTAAPNTLITNYNASTPTSFPSALTVFRTAIAALPSGAKVSIMDGGSDRSIVDLMTSSADSISSQTGATMFANSVAGVYLQGPVSVIPFSGGAFSNDFIDWTAGQYMLANNGSVPLRWFSGSPFAAGPGILHTHTTNDPFYNLIAGQLSEARTCWDCLPATNFMTTIFQGTPISGTLTITDATHGSGTTTPNSQHYTYPLSSLGTDLVYTWFLNSLINVLPQGQPRPN